jgi:iron complex outermembrane receptor protein
VCAALAGVAFIAPAGAAAQGAGAGSVLVGTVIADSSSAPLAGAEVLVEALRRSTRSGDDGSFVLRGLPAGLHVVTVRGVGYDPLVVRVRATGAAGDTVAADFALARRTVTLARVDVKGGATPVVRAAERARARHNGGAFVGREALVQHEHSTMSEVLRRVPGVNVQRVSTPRGSINAMASTRGGSAQSLRSPDGPKWCYYQIYLDGVKIYSPEMGEPPDLDTFRPGDYDGVEIYRGLAETPPAYGGTGAACGTVLFWSRTR